MKTIKTFFDSARMRLYSALMSYERATRSVQDRFDIDNYEMMLLYFVKGVLLTVIVNAIGASKVAVALGIGLAVWLAYKAVRARFF